MPAQSRQHTTLIDHTQGATHVPSAVLMPGCLGMLHLKLPFWVKFKIIRGCLGGQLLTRAFLYAHSERIKVNVSVWEPIRQICDTFWGKAHHSHVFTLSNARQLFLTVSISRRTKFATFSLALERFCAHGPPSVCSTATDATDPARG